MGHYETSRIRVPPRAASAAVACGALALAAVLSLAPATAVAAPHIFLNGVAIDGVKSQEFKNCSVRIDEKGNVHITAKGYAVQSGGKAPDQVEPQNPGAPPTKRYFLVTEKAAPGMSQYDIDLFINAKWVRKLLDDEEHIYFEITQHLVQGDNKIRFLAKKNMKDGRRSTSPNHYFRVVIGEGDMGGRNVMITKKLVDYKRSAFETQDFTNEHTIPVF